MPSATKTQRSGKLRGQFKIDVTTEDITEATFANSGHCPAARAITRALEEKGIKIKAPNVNKDRIRFSFGDLRYECPSPKNLATRIVAADKSHKMTPFSFVLDIDQATTTQRPGLSYRRVGHEPVNEGSTGTRNRRVGGM